MRDCHCPSSRSQAPKRHAGTQHRSNKVTCDLAWLCSSVEINANTRSWPRYSSRVPSCGIRSSSRLIKRSLAKGRRREQRYCKECGLQIMQVHLENCLAKGKAAKRFRNGQIPGGPSRHPATRRMMTTLLTGIQNNYVRLWI